MLKARKTSPKVVGGAVQRKNRWDLSPSYYSDAQPWPVVDRQRPGHGRHLLHRSDVHRFLKLLPDWDELSRGLNAIVLARHEEGTDGYHSPGVVHICAWEAELWTWGADHGYVRDHVELFDRIGLVRTKRGGRIVLEWTVEQARAYQLLHVLVHELGHHHDRMTTRSKVMSRGEPFAEAYAARTADRLWERYCAEFGDPAVA